MKLNIISNFGGLIRSCFWKKDKRIVVIDCWFGQKFADNSRYLFQYLSDNKEKLGLTHVVWVTRNTEVNRQINAMGYECYMLDSKESEDYHRRAYYHICNNAPVESTNYKGEILGKYSFRSKRINLWHGTGVIKTFNMASNEYKVIVSKHPILYRIKNFFYSNVSVFRKIVGSEGGWDDCYFLTTSESECEKFKKCYPLPKKKFIISGYPRNAYQVNFLEREKEVVSLLNDYKISILYLPTFRSAGNEFDFSTVADNLKLLLKEKNILLIQKAHFVDKKRNEMLGVNENVLTLDSDFDINILTPLMTYVMTDYSSILADALYHNKPVLLYVPDYDEYMRGDRGFSEDAEYLLSACKKFFDLDSLKKYILENCDNPDNAKTNEYDAIRTKIWGNENRTIEQIWEDIVKQTE